MISSWKSKTTFDCRLRVAVTHRWYAGHGLRLDDLLLDGHLPPELPQSLQDRFAPVVGLHLLEMYSRLDLLEQFVVRVLLLAVVEELSLGLGLGQQRLGPVVALDVLEPLVGLDLFEHRRPIGPDLGPRLELIQDLLLFVGEGFRLDQFREGRGRGWHRRRSRRLADPPHALLSHQGVPRRRRNLVDGLGIFRLEVLEAFVLGRFRFDAAEFDGYLDFLRLEFGGLLGRHRFQLGPDEGVFGRSVLLVLGVGFRVGGGLSELRSCDGKLITQGKISLISLLLWTVAGASSVLLLPLLEAFLRVHGAVGTGSGLGPSLTHGGLKLVLPAAPPLPPPPSPPLSLPAGIVTVVALVKTLREDF